MTFNQAFADNVNTSNSDRGIVQENVVFLTQKATAHDTCGSELNFVGFIDYNVEIGAVSCGIYYMKMAI